MWYVTSDMWDMEGGEHWTLNTEQSLQIVKSLAHTVWEWRCLEDFLTKGSPTEWMNDKGVCRTALAAPGLLKCYIAHQ